MTDTALRPGLKTLLTLAWPVILSRSTQSVIGICDALMCASLGQSALAAVLNGALNTFWVLIVPWGTVTIVQSFAAQMTGMGDRGGARRFGWYGLWIAGIATLLGAVAVPFVPGAIGLFDYEPQVAGFMAQYLAVRLWGTGLAIGVEALGAYFGGLGNTRIHLAANIVAMVLNVPLNWMLIHGNLGCPALGVVGAALASVIATGGAFAIMLAAFWRMRSLGPIGRRSMREFGRVLRFGVPNGFNWFLEFAAFALFLNAVVPKLGTAAVAAMGIVLNVNSFSFMPSFGISSAGAILVGQAIGKERREDVAGILARTFGVAAAWQVLVGVFYVLVPGAILGAFAVPEDAGRAQVLAVGTTMLAISAAWQLFDAAGIAIGEALRAAGDTAFCMWARLVLAWAFFAPLAWLWVVKGDGGPEAAVWSVVIYLAAISCTLGLRFRAGVWKRIALVEPSVG